MTQIIRDGELVTLTEEEAAIEFPPTEPQPEPVPQFVSRFQARAALLQAGKLADVQALIDASDAFTQLAWNEAIEFRRDSALINALAAHPAMNMSQAELDDLFRVAALIEA